MLNKIIIHVIINSIGFVIFASILDKWNQDSVIGWSIGAVITFAFICWKTPSKTVHVEVEKPIEDGSQTVSIVSKDKIENDSNCFSVPLRIRS